MPGTALFEKPRWLRDLLRFLPLKSQFVLSGNIRDLQACEVVPGTVTAQSFNQTLCDALLDAGYAQVLAWDPLAGFRVLGRPGSEAGATPQVLLDLGLTPVDGAAPAGTDLLGATLQRLVNRSGEPIALIVDFASRLAVRNDALSAAEHQLFTQALVLSHQARSRPAGEQRKPFFNSVLWVVEKEGDLPDWLLVDNPRLRHIPVSKPDQAARRALAPTLLRGLGGAGVAEEALQQAAATFVENTEGLLLLDLNAIVQLARVEGLAMERIADAVRRYKVGVTEDPWLKIDRQRIRQADEIVRRRVKGQQHAVTHMLDIVKRAMTGVGASRKGNRPRGVAFLAGPTGVGKTELAKTVTSLLFGDESAYIRFDMSEFSAEHADQRLIGAPPGYVGYDVGGELTNAIREKPFSVVLFDEIEKAHPRILDKFLQILDDGVLTSGRGDRVYFSEALIVFTSNLGIYRQGKTANGSPTCSPASPSKRCRARSTARSSATSSWFSTARKSSTGSARTSSSSTSSAPTSPSRSSPRWSTAPSPTSASSASSSNWPRRRARRCTTSAWATCPTAAAASATSSKRACSTRCRGRCSTRTRSRASAS